MILSASDEFEPERIQWSLLPPCKKSLSENGANTKQAGPRDKESNEIVMTLFEFFCSLVFENFIVTWTNKIPFCLNHLSRIFCKLSTKYLII